MHPKDPATIATNVSPSFCFVRDKNKSADIAVSKTSISMASGSMYLPVGY